MRIGKIAVIVIGLVPFNVYGECTPTPDCADMGYTETSCEGDSLKCPFDTSKLKCMPCDSSFKYNCSGDNITSGIGSVCGGKYVSCECSSTDYIFSNGACVCDTSCKVGAIYYSDGSCSSCVDTAKTAIGVVVKDNELIMSNNLTAREWGGTTDIENLTNYSTANEAKSDFNGKNNTSIIVSIHTSLGLNSSNSAAIACNEYSVEGVNVGDWYLPALGELSYIFDNSSKVEASITSLGWIFGTDYYWSSSEESGETAWGANIYGARCPGGSKRYKTRFTCFLAL